MPLADVKKNPEQLQLLESWMRAQKPAELFDDKGRLVPELKALAPKSRAPHGRQPSCQWRHWGELSRHPRTDWVCHATLIDMRATIELPEPVFQILQARAEQRSLSIQAVILEAINKEIASGPTPAEVQGRVSLPLIRSSRPGSFHSLTNAGVDDVLG